MTITTIRPNGLVINSHLLNFGGGATTPQGATSDNSDTTYISGRVDKQYVRVALADVTVSANQRVKSCQIRIRNAADPAGLSGTQDTLTSLLDNNNTKLAAVGQITVQRGLTSINTATGPVSYKGPGGAAWTQTSVNSLGAQTQWFAGRGSTPNVYQRVYEVYVDVDISTQPVVTGTPVVTNFTNNATPTVTWLYDDVDDEPQVRWQVRIFTAAQVAMGSFSADNTEPIWDSGEQSGPTDNVTVAVPLVNGVSYNAYVKVAQAWPGPQGRYWWSNWVSSAAFTVTFTLPYAPTVAVSQITDSNALRALIDVDVPVNMLTNETASLETSIGAWLSDINCTVARITTDGADGIASLQMTATAGGTMQAAATAGITTLANLVETGKTYTFLASFKTAVTARSCAVGVYWYDYAGVLLSGTATFGANVTDNSANWNTQASLTIVAPAGASYAVPVVKVTSAAAAEVHKVDKISMSLGTSTSWTPGGYTNDQGDLLLERGDRVDTHRGIAENWAHPQVASAGTLMQTHDAGFEWTNNVERLSWGWLDKTIPAPGYTPAGMIRWLPMTATITGITFGSTTTFASASAGGPQIDYLFPCVVAQPHVFSVWAWVDSSTLSVTPKIQWRDQTQAIISTSTGAAVTLTTTPQLVTISATCPTLGVFASGYVENTGASNTKRIFFTRIGWGPGTSPVDGKTAKGGPLNWTRVRFPYQSPIAQQLAGFPAGLFTGQHEKWVDFDASPGRPLVYRASISYSNASGIVLGSPYSVYQTTLLTPPPVTLLRSVTNPTLQVAVNRRKQSTFTHVEDAQIFHPLGADGGPVRVRDWVGGEDGQLIVVTSTEAQYARLAQLVNTSDVLLIQWAQGGLTYCLVTDRSTDETLSTDVDFCDVDGSQSWIKYGVTSLTYLETVAP